MTSVFSKLNINLISSTNITEVLRNLTVQPSTQLKAQRLFTKLRDTGLNSCLCAWVLGSLTGRSQVVRAGRCLSNSITGCWGCCCTPCTSISVTHSSSTIAPFAEGTVVLDFISNNKKTIYSREVENFALSYKIHCLYCNWTSAE